MLHPGIVKIIWLMAVLAIVSGCSQAREAMQDSASSADFSGMYPHASNWRAQHMAYYPRVAAKSRVHQQACLGCHENKRKGRPLNISCGATCHEKRPAKIVRGNQARIQAINHECAGCHAKKFNDTVSHHPVSLGLCNLCHEASPQHLSGADPKAVVTDVSEKTCYGCHDRKDDSVQVHGALSDSLACSNCHDPHGARREFLIRAETSELCQNCHGEASRGGSLHAAAVSGASCLGCHVPHAGPRAKLLTSDPEAQCLSCHSEMGALFQKASVHGALESGCRSCHDPHSSDHQKLLKGAYPKAEHQAFSGAQDFAICFQCHDSELVDPAGAGSTGFRNGPTNLHWVHVANAGATTGPDWGRTCRVCHEPHAADQPKLLKSGLGPYRVSMRFESLANGGQCTASCHGPKAYFR